MTDPNGHGPWRKTAEEAALAIFIILVHALVGVVIISVFWGLERYIHWLYGDHDPMVLNLVPLRFIIEGADSMLVVGVLVFSTISAFRNLRS